MQIQKQPKPYLVLAYYDFTPIADPFLEVKKHKDFFQGRDITSRIYISEEGINGQMSASRQDGNDYIQWMQARPEFAHVFFKQDEWDEQVFPRQTVKYRKHLVARNQPINLAKRGQHLSPEEWKKKLESDEKPLLIDVRNDYEWKLGHFEGAHLPPCNQFREFEEYAETLKNTQDPKNTPVMMYCTGGIRCELYSSILIEKGFTHVYQLEGGIVNYGHKVGSKHWVGKLFVFDDRLSVPISEEPHPVIGACHHCNHPTEAYYNCANMDCNTLFLCCPDCLKKWTGCCQLVCQEGPRVRPYHEHSAHKPFRRKHLIDVPQNSEGTEA